MGVISWLVRKLGGVVPGEGIVVERDLYDKMLNAFHSLQYHNNCSGEINELQERLDESERDRSSERRARIAAEANVNSLEQQIQFLSDQLREALAFERDTFRGLQFRLGLIQQDKPAAPAEQKPIRSTTAPWSAVASRLERQSSEQSKKPEDERAAYWTKKIEQVERQDQAVTGASGATQETEELARDLAELNAEDRTTQG